MQVQAPECNVNRQQRFSVRLTKNGAAGFRRRRVAPQPLSQVCVAISSLFGEAQGTTVRRYRVLRNRGAITEKLIGFRANSGRKWDLLPPQSYSTWVRG